MYVSGQSACRLTTRTMQNLYGSLGFAQHATATSKGHRYSRTFNCEQRHDGYPGAKSARNPTRGSYGQKLLTINVEVVEHQGKRAHKFPQVTLPFARSLALAIVEMGNRREH
jgi:hypothetical protein